jgi:tetratricopeptide (TPR) repeat protein
MKSGFDAEFTAVHEKFQNLLKRHMNDSLLCFAQFLTEYKRFDEAKQLYGQLLSQNADKNKKCACYEGLCSIANKQNDTSEATIMHQKTTETKFGTELPTTNASGILLTKTEHEEFQTNRNQIMNLDSKMSLDWLLDESSADVQSDDYRNSLQQTTQLAYKLATMMMKKGEYMLPIQLFEGTLPMMELQDTAGFDPLLKAKYYMQLGHCYRELKFDTTALENYKLSLEQNIHLPLDEYIETLIGLGAVLEATNDYKDALYRYIEIAEIYQDNSTIGGLEERHHIEECIQRVTSHLISVD